MGRIDSSHHQSMMVLQAPNIDVDDLEADATAEDLMLSYVSGEKGKVGDQHNRCRDPDHAVSG